MRLLHSMYLSILFEIFDEEHQPFLKIVVKISWKLKYTIQKPTVMNYTDCLLITDISSSNNAECALAFKRIHLRHHLASSLKLC